MLMSKIPAALGIVLLLFATVGAAYGADQLEGNFTIIYSADRRGEIVPCG